jgi:hypothetical protein
MYYSYMLYFFLEKFFKLYMFRMLLSPIIRSTTVVHSHRFFYGFGVFCSIEQVLLLGQFDTLARSVTDYKTNTQIAKELKITTILDKLLEYKRNWKQHVNIMSRNRLPRVMKHYYVGWGCLRIGCWRGCLGLRGMRWHGNRESYIMKSWIICIPHPVLCGWLNRQGWDGQDMWRV